MRRAYKHIEENEYDVRHQCPVVSEPLRPGLALHENRMRRTFLMVDHQHDS